MKDVLSIEQIASINEVDDQTAFKLIEQSKMGIDFNLFEKIVDKSVLDYKEWSKLLDTSERTLQRYKKENRAFSLSNSERILTISILDSKGRDVFESEENFRSWLFTQNRALAGRIPFELMNTLFGLELLRDELLRIEHGVLS